MSFGDFNHDGHTSLPEAMYAYGMLEDSDTGGDEPYVPRSAKSKYSARGCINGMLVFFGALVLISLLELLFS